jgi:hypothetical protein
MYKICAKTIVIPLQGKFVMEWHKNHILINLQEFMLLQLFGAL